jgi:hypothetical protein
VWLKTCMLWVCPTLFDSKYRHIWTRSHRLFGSRGNHVRILRLRIEDEIDVVELIENPWYEVGMDTSLPRPLAGFWQGGALAKIPDHEQA